MKEFDLMAVKGDVERLLTYVPWLESKVGATVSKMYDDGTLTKTIAFPVYDTMLLNFVNDAGKTGLMDKNYIYAYSGYSLRSHADEKRAIENAGVKDGALLCGILSKYVLGGMTKGKLWTEAVENGIFLDVLLKMKKLLEIWDGPLV